MKIITRVLPDSHNLFLFGDEHLGTILHHKKGFAKLIKMISTSYAGVPTEGNFAISHGDCIEGIMIDDKRFDPATQLPGQQVPFPMLQANDYCDLIDPIKEKILFILEGNHPEKLWKFGPITKEICRLKGIEYGTWTAKLVVNDSQGNLMYKSYHTHGRRGITSNADDIQRREDNMRLILKRQLEDQAGDTVLMCKAHVHKLLIREPMARLYMTDAKGDVEQAYTESVHTASWIHPDHRWYVCTGSFYRLFGKGISGYAEKAEYKPNELGFIIARIRDKKIKGIDKIIV